MVGRDPEGIAAASVWLERDGGQLIELKAMAVALRLRNRGLHLGDEIMTETFDLITSMAVQRGHTQVELIGFVYERNDASLKLLQRHGFEYSGPGEPGVREYCRVLPIAL